MPTDAELVTTATAAETAMRSARTAVTVQQMRRPSAMQSVALIAAEIDLARKSGTVEGARTDLRMKRLGF